MGRKERRMQQRYVNKRLTPEQFQELQSDINQRYIEEEVQKLMRDIGSNLQYAVLQRDQFSDIMEEIAQVRCVGCKDDYRQCSIHKALDDASVPYCGEEPNCPYAADLSKFSLKEKKHIEELKEKLHKKNQFYKEA